MKKALILAGGLGTRLRPITYETPKPLITVKKKPILNYLIDLFVSHGVSEIGILASLSHKEDFRRWRMAWHNELSEKNITIFYEEEPRGTFGGMELVKDWLGNEPFFFSNGDELKDFDLTKLKEFHGGHDGHATIALVQVPNPNEYGVPILEENRIKEFLEKPENPPSDFISSGLYILDPEVVNYADFSQDYIMIEKDIFPKLAQSGKLYGSKMEGGKWYDCGTLERWEKAIEEW